MHNFAFLANVFKLHLCHSACTLNKRCREEFVAACLPSSKYPLTMNSNGTQARASEV